MIARPSILFGLCWLLGACGQVSRVTDGDAAAEVTDALELRSDAATDATQADLDLALPDLQSYPLFADLARVEFLPGGLANADLRALGRRGDLTLAAGDRGLLLRRVAQGAFGPVATSDQRDLNGLWLRDDGSALICGDGGALLELDSTGLHPFSPAPPTQADLLAIAGSGQRFYLTGAEGLLLFFDGQAFVPQESFLASALTSVALRSMVEVAVGSAQGSVLRLEGDAWINNQILGNNSAVTALGFAGDGSLYAGGLGGEIAVLQGGLWKAAASNDPLARSIRAVDPDEPLFVGDGGLLLVPSGKNWVLDASSLPPGFNRDLWALLPGEANLPPLLAGSGGTLLARDPGGVWRPQAALPQAELSAATPDALGGLWLAGRDFLYHSVDGVAWQASPLDAPGLLRTLLPLPEGGVLAAGPAGRLLEVQEPGGPVLVHSLGEASELHCLCRLDAQTLLLGGAGGYLGLMDSAHWTVQRLESGHALTVATCLTLEAEGVVLVPGPPGLVWRVDGAGERSEESLPKPLALRQLLAAGGGRVRALLEDGSVVSRDAEGVWKLDFAAPMSTETLLAMPDGRILGGGRQGQLWAWTVGGEALGGGALPQPSPVALLAAWNGLVFAGGGGGRLYSAPLTD